MNILTGNKDVAFVIPQILNDKDLTNIFHLYGIIQIKFNMNTKEIFKSKDYYGFGSYPEVYCYLILF